MIEDQHLRFIITEELFLVNEPEEQEYSPVRTEIADEEVSPSPSLNVAEGPQKVHELAIWSPPLTSQDKELLSKILKAINKDFSLIYLMEGINNYEPNYKTLLCFGFQKELSLKINKSPLPLYQPVNIEGCTVLVSVSPADLQSDKTQKALLWEALQKVFLS